MTGTIHRHEMPSTTRSLRTRLQGLALDALVCVTALVAVTSPAAAATSAPVTLTFAGHTSRERGYVYHFAVPYGRHFAVSWTSRPYPSGAHDSPFTLDVAGYNDPNNAPCPSVKEWCAPDPAPASGSQTFFSWGSGPFSIGVFAQEAQWAITVDITKDRTAPKPAAPGIGDTITVPAIPGASGRYQVALLQVVNTLSWANPSGFHQGTRPVVIKVRITDDGFQPLDLIASEVGIYSAVGGTGFSLSSSGRTYLPTDMTNTYALAGCRNFGDGTPGTLLPGEAAVGCLDFAYSATRPLAGSELWLQSGWLSDGQTLGQLYHWVLDGPPW